MATSTDPPANTRRTYSDKWGLTKLDMERVGDGVRLTITDLINDKDQTIVLTYASAFDLQAQIRRHGHRATVADV